MRKLSEMIKYYRTVASFSMIELAEKSGISNSYINEIEKGRKIPPFDTLQKIMIALKLSENQKQELIELTKHERFQHKVNTEQKKLSEMTHDEREKVLDEYRADLPGIPINYIDKPSEEVAAMGEAEVNKRYYVYTCSTRDRKKGCDNLNIRKELIEKFVIDEIRHNIFTDKMIDKITKDTLEYIKTSENTNKKELSRLTALANTTQSKIDKLLDAYLDDHINKTMLSEKTNKLKQELDNYNEQIYDLQIRSYDFLDEEKIKAFYLSFKTKIESNDEKLLRQIIEMFVHKIFISKDEIKLILIFDSIIHSMDRGMSGGGEAHLSPPLSITKNKLYEIF